MTQIVQRCPRHNLVKALLPDSIRRQFQSRQQAVKRKRRCWLSGIESASVIDKAERNPFTDSAAPENRLSCRAKPLEGKRQTNECPKLELGRLNGSAQSFSDGVLAVVVGQAIWAVLLRHLLSAASHFVQ